VCRHTDAKKQERPSVNLRPFRIGTGLVLWTYIAAHLSNHALGLISLGAAERGMELAVTVWHSWPGTFLLYGAFALHLSLALTGLYLRPTLLLPPMELLRIAFGLSFPLLLVGHAVSTRIAYEWYGALPQYQRVVWSLINSGAEGRQLALLAPGWLHGCMGLGFAMRDRPIFQRWKWPLAALVVLLPLAAAGGFLSMNAEVAGLLQDPVWRSRGNPELPTAHARALGHLREQLLDGYFGLLAGVIVLRLVRWVRQRVQAAT
jgi:adenylate cyclase